MKRIEQMYAYLVEDEDAGLEGVAGIMRGDTMVPMVGADKARFESLKGHAQIIATASGKPVRLVRFEVRTELEVFEP